MLDALYYSCVTKSANTSSDRHVVRRGEDFFRIEAGLERKDGKHSVVAKVQPGKLKVFEIDGRKYNVNNNRAHMLDSDVALFRDMGSDELRSYVQIPSAKCKYFRNRKEFRWDMTYSITQQKHFLKLLEEATVASIEEK